MATSASTDFSMFRSAVIKGALRKIGAIGPGEDTPATEISDLGESLNAMVTDLQNDGVRLWQLRRASFSLTANDADYDLANDVLDVMPEETYVRYTTDNTDTKLALLTREKYMNISKKGDTTNTTGIPVQYFVDKVRAATSGSHEYMGLLTMYLYPTPDSTAASNYTLHYTAIRKLEDLDNEGHDFDWPTRWLRPLTLLFAADLSNDYGLAIEQRRHLISIAEDRKKVAERADSERGGFRLSPRWR